MIRSNPIATVLAVLSVVAVLDFALLASNYRILVGERRSHTTIVPGEVHIWASTAEIGYDTVECSYFTGRSVQVSTARSYEMDKCPLVFRPRTGL